MPDINMHLKEFRIFRQITQEELASKIGKSKNVISNWESGLNRPDVDSVENICEILHVTPNQIFGWEPLPEYEHHKRYLKDIEQKREAIRRELEEKQMQLYKLDAEYKLMLENSTQEPGKNAFKEGTKMIEPFTIGQPHRNEQHDKPKSN